MNNSINKQTTILLLKQINKSMDKYLYKQINIKKHFNNYASRVRSFEFRPAKSG